MLKVCQAFLSILARVRLSRGAWLRLKAFQSQRATDTTIASSGNFPNEQTKHVCGFIRRSRDPIGEFLAR
jgi:hypothetical protein